MIKPSSYLYGKLYLLCVLIFLIAGCTLVKKNQRNNKYSTHVISYDKNENATNHSVKPVVKYHPLQTEFSQKLSVPADSIYNLKLYAFIKEWLGTPYLWGGTGSDGIDCSAFVKRLYHSVYDVYVPRTSIEQFYANWVDLYSNTKYLREGDLVFFKTMRNYDAVTHVGFYLHNGYFVNASSSKGVSIGSLRDDYWADKYVACGRLKASKQNNKK
jgi:lipoprotein Spr